MGMKPLPPQDDSPAEQARFAADTADAIANPSNWACGPEHRPTLAAQPQPDRLVPPPAPDPDDIGDSPVPDKPVKKLVAKPA